MVLVEVDDRTKDFVVSLAEHFHGELSEVTVGDAAKISNTTRKNAYNILEKLRFLGMVDFTPLGFRLTERFYMLYAFSGYNMYFITPYCSEKTSNRRIKHGG